MSSTKTKEVNFDMHKMLYTNINCLTNRVYAPDYIIIFINEKLFR
jgi:hypothetical protein